MYLFENTTQYIGLIEVFKQALYFIQHCLDLFFRCREFRIPTLRQESLHALVSEPRSLWRSCTIYNNQKRRIKNKVYEQEQARLVQVFHVVPLYGNNAYTWLTHLGR
jgi:hypothetical protein